MKERVRKVVKRGLTYTARGIIVAAALMFAPVVALGALVAWAFDEELKRQGGENMTALLLLIGVFLAIGWVVLLFQVILPACGIALPGW